jgi:hypothetical protein
MGPNNHPTYLDANHKKLAENAQKYHEKHTFWDKNAALSREVIKSNGLKDLACAIWGKDINDKRSYSLAPECLDVFNAVQLVRFSKSDAEILKSAVHRNLDAREASQLSNHALSTIARWTKKSEYDLKLEGIALSQENRAALGTALSNEAPTSVGLAEIIDPAAPVAQQSQPYTIHRTSSGAAVHAVDPVAAVPEVPAARHPNISPESIMLVEYTGSPAQKETYAKEIKSNKLEIDIGWYFKRGRYPFDEDLDENDPTVKADRKHFAQSKKIMIVSSHSHNVLLGIIHVTIDANRFDSKDYFEYQDDASRNVLIIKSIEMDKQYQGQGYEERAIQLLLKETIHQYNQQINNKKPIKMVELGKGFLPRLGWCHTSLLKDGNIVRTAPWGIKWDDHIISNKQKEALGFTCIDEECKTALKAVTLTEQEKIERLRQETRREQDKDTQAEIKATEKAQQQEADEWIHQRVIEKLYVDHGDNELSPYNARYAQPVSVGSDSEGKTYSDEPNYSFNMDFYKNKHEAWQRIIKTDPSLDRKLSQYLKKEALTDPDEAEMLGRKHELSKNNCANMPKDLAEKLAEARLLGPYARKRPVSENDCNMLMHLRAYGNLQREELQRRSPQRDPNKPKIVRTRVKKDEGTSIPDAWWFLS